MKNILTAAVLSVGLATSAMAEGPSMDANDIEQSMVEEQQNGIAMMLTMIIFLAAIAGGGSSPISSAPPL